MIEVVGIRFKKAGKMYYFDPAGIKLEKEDGAIVETARGIEYGTVIKGNSFVPEEAIVPPLKQVMRRATEEDTKSVEQNHKKETEAFGICLEKISRLGLDMKLVERTPSGVRLTAAESVIYQNSRFIIDYSQKTITNAKAALHAKDKTFFIGKCTYFSANAGEFR